MRLRNTITAAGVVVASGLIGMAIPAATMAAPKDRHEHSGPYVSLVRLSSQPAQHRPAAPVTRLPKYSCVTGSLGDQLCCVWHVTYPGYGFGTWDDCVLIAKP